MTSSSDMINANNQMQLVHIYHMLTLTTGIYIIFRIIIILDLNHSWTKQTKQKETENPVRHNKHPEVK